MAAADDTCVKRKRRKTTQASSREDIVSELPDEVLCIVLSLLNVREAVRTTVLSSRWRRLFSSTLCQPDAVDDQSLWSGDARPCSDDQWKEPARWCADSVASSLLAYDGPIRRFCIYHTPPRDRLTALALPMLARRGGIHELVIRFPADGEYGEVPASTLYNRELRSLNLANCWCMECSKPLTEPSSKLMLPHLTQLTLDHTRMAAERVEGLLSRCPTLESFSLGRWRMDMPVSIRSHSLRCLTLKAELYPSVIIEEAPNLERVLWWPGLEVTSGDPVETTGLPKLQLLGVIRFRPPAATKHYRSINVAKLHSVQFPTLKTIALSINAYNYDEANQSLVMLSLLPCLETLHFELTSDQDDYGCFSLEDMAGHIPCLESSVKTIVLWALNFGRRRHRSPLAGRSLAGHCQCLEFARFLLRRATALETMTIRTSRSSSRRAFRLMAALPPATRASEHGRVGFAVAGKDDCTLEFDRAASNIDLDDPFVSGPPASALPRWNNDFII